ncbi:alpha/beta hydrolase [Sagittula salina]|uniref:Alpha/beta fold hydrolase n=1 Tax=Sagittula salina TaxID=2820268 RepID=A0A940MN50_9RHOB|nr:alpha/beta fold hydrolase [Sagittula salina]
MTAPAAAQAVPEGGITKWLAAGEARLPDLRPGVEKRVIWRGAPEAVTDWAVVYVHGFSATSEELRPLPDRVAEGLSANLHFTRLAGHGRAPAAMAEVTLEAWLRDVAEALEIGRRIGRRVLVMGCSTGCTLVTLALHRGLAAGVAGVVMLSPNYRLRDPRASLMTWPLARWWLPLVAGREHGFAPLSEAHGRFWTTRYPSRALLPMAEGLRAATALDHGSVRVPGLFVFDERDALVDHDRTRQVAAAWGVPSDVQVVTTGPGDDPGHHVIAGDILSPGLTRPLTETILRWARGLPSEHVRNGA